MSLTQGSLTLHDRRSAQSSIISGNPSRPSRLTALAAFMPRENLEITDILTEVLLLKLLITASTPDLGVPRIIQ